MKEIYDGLYVGDDRDCQTAPSDWAVVHACKHSCHQDAVGYQGSLSSDHPEYLVADREADLYLNLVDMDRPLSHEYTEPIIEAAFDFINIHLPDREVLIHCNQGQSRSPALALLYLVKREEVIPNEDYATAKAAFSERYPAFVPGNGVDSYLRKYWMQLGV